MERRTFSIRPDRESIPRAEAFVEEAMESAGVGMREMMKINVAMDEIYSNIVFYSGATIAEIESEIDGNAVKITLKDDGAAYDPLKREDPDITLGIDEREAGGLGILMTKKLLDDVHYRYENGKNVMELIKIRSSEKK